MKSLDLDNESYMFETFDELIEMLKSDGYNLTLNIRENGNIKSKSIKL